MLVVPPDWEAIPEGLTELKRCLAEEYGASLLLRPSSVPMRSPMPLAGVAQLLFTLFLSRPARRYPYTFVSSFAPSYCSHCPVA